MRVLLDECLPERLKHELPEHQVRTVREAGLAGKKNGALLEFASTQFDVLVTIDRNLPQASTRPGAASPSSCCTRGPTASPRSYRCCRSSGTP
jgi:predicted nuclease of predicted toxin-antitoxin system